MRTDVAIIGAGTAGLAAERSARRAGARTLLIDESFNGTTCANVGCMPSKLLIAAANAADAVRRSAAFGIRAVRAVDGPAVMVRLRAERDAFARATRDEIGRLPNGVAIRGRAHFVDRATLELNDGRRIEAGSVVIATGSCPAVPGSFESIQDRVLTNESLFEIEDLPRSLAVVGAGPLGLELAQALSRLDVSVTVFAEDRKLAGIEDETLVECMSAVFERDFDLHLGVRLRSHRVGHQVCVQWEGESSGERLFDCLLVAAGRPPSLKSLRLEAAGLALDKRGVPVFDRTTLQCGEGAIFIAGDAAADRPVLHEASMEGALAGYNAASYPKVTSTHRSPKFSIMFTDPPLALIGEHSGASLIRGESDYRHQGRARVEARAQGLACIYADRTNARVKGAALFCPGADHLSHLLAWAIEDELDATALLDRPFYHPTFEEGLKPALRQICARVGAASPSSRDEGAASGA